MTDSRSVSTEDEDHVGITDIASRLGVKPGTVKMWRKRTADGEMNVPFPKERGTVSDVPWWDWPTVQAWHEAHEASRTDRTRHVR